MNLILRPSDDSETGWLDGLRRAAYQDLFQATWGGWDEARHSRHFAASIERGQISLIEVDGEPVGMLQVFEEGNRVEVGEIQILPAYQNRGIGRRVLLELIGTAQAKGQQVLLSLGLKNEGAYRLYSALGFQESSRSDTHIHMMLESASKNDKR